MGIDEARGDKIEVLNARFNRDLAVVGGEEVTSSLLNFTKDDIMRGVELLVLLITGLLLIFFVLRPLLKTASGVAAGGAGQLQLAGAGGVTSLQSALMGPDGAMAQLGGPSEIDQRLDIARIEGQVKASSVKKVAEFVEKHPEESVAILRSWIHEA